MCLRNSHLFWQKITEKNKTFWKHPILTVRIIPSLTVVWCFPWTCFQSFLNWAEECLTEPPGWLCLRKRQRIQSSSENMITHAHLMRRRSNTKGLTPLLRNLEIWRSSPHSPNQELINQNNAKQYSVFTTTLFVVEQADYTNLGAPIWYANLGTLCWSPQPFSKLQAPRSHFCTTRKSPGVTLADGLVAFDVETKET